MRTMLASLMLAVLAGCAVGPSYRTPAVDPPGTFAVSPTGTEPVGEQISWWQSLQDPELDSLIERAVQSNPDIGIALDRLQQVRAQERVLLGNVLPEMGASVAAGRGTGSDLARAGASPALRAADNKYQMDQISEVAGFAATWEVDLFGGYRRALEAGRYDVQAAADMRGAVIIGVIADVARNYVRVRGMQTRIAIVQSQIGVAQQSRELAHARYERGLTNELTPQLAERELAVLQSRLPALQSSLQRSQYRIAALVGKYPETMSSELNQPGALPMLPKNVTPGLPLELIRRRPDIRMAERQLASSTALIGVATSRLFPHISLTGGLGTQSDAVGIEGTHIWAFGPSVYWPLLDFGSLDASISAADMRARADLLRYKRSIITAVGDVDSALAEYEAQQRRLEDLRGARAAGRRAVELAQQRYERGLSDYLNVVDAERSQYALEDDYAAVEQNAAEAVIYVFEALGGGWQGFQDIPPMPRPEPAAIAIFHRMTQKKQSPMSLEDPPGS